MLNNWENVILHADADCFYASCEVLKDSTLKNQPLIVVSSIGGITLARSYEAKPFGIKTGTPHWEAKKLCPEIKIKLVDFNFYANISEKINLIFKDLSPVVEKYSIDESFIDLSSSTKCRDKTFEEIASNLRYRIKNDVGINVSVGIAQARILAKIASDYNKPDGFKVVYPFEIKAFLETVNVENICGIGRNRKILLNELGINTAYDFYKLSEKQVYNFLGKIGVEIWLELHGNSIYCVSAKQVLPKGIMRSQSFTKLSKDRDFLWSKIVRHCEEVSDKLCKMNLLAGGVYIFFRTKNFEHIGDKIIFSRSTCEFKTLVSNCKYLFNKVYKNKIMYRSAGVGAIRIISKEEQQLDLFNRFEDDFRSNSLAFAKRELRHKFGDTIISPAVLGGSHYIHKELNTSKIKLV